MYDKMQFFDSSQSEEDFLKRYKALDTMTSEEKKNRPLYIMKRTEFKIKDGAPKWLYDVSNALKNNPKKKIYGGNLKDIIFLGANVYRSLFQGSQKYTRTI